MCKNLIYAGEGDVGVLHDPYERRTSAFCPALNLTLTAAVDSAHADGSSVLPSIQPTRKGNPVDQQLSQQVESRLREQWSTICPQILNRFTTVSKADLDAANNVDDLIRSVADLTRHSERYVETEITGLVLSGGGSGMRDEPFGAATAGPWQGGGQQPQQGQTGR